MNGLSKEQIIEMLSGKELTPELIAEVIVKNNNLLFKQIPDNTFKIMESEMRRAGIR